MPTLLERHAGRTANDVEWQNLKAELRDLRNEKVVSLNEQVRRKQRDDQEARRKARGLASGHATPDADPTAKTLEKIRDDANDSASGKHDETSLAKADAISGADKTQPGVADETKDLALRDDGLQADERSIANEIKREEKQKERRDVVLDEAAHILADEIGLVRADTKLAAQVLPRGAIVPTEVNWSVSARIAESRVR